MEKLHDDTQRLRAGRLGILGLSYQEARLCERTAHDHRERFEGQRHEDAAVHPLAKRAPEHHRAPLAVDTAPGVGAEDRACVTQDDPLHRRIGVDLDVGAAGRDDPVPGVLGVRVAAESLERGCDLRAELALHLLEHRPEELLLAGEVVVERALGHPRLSDNRIKRRFRVAAGAEKVTPGGEQRLARRLALPCPR